MKAPHTALTLGQAFLARFDFITGTPQRSADIPRMRYGQIKSITTSHTAGQASTTRANGTFWLRYSENTEETKSRAATFEFADTDEKIEDADNFPAFFMVEISEKSVGDAGGSHFSFDAHFQLKSEPFCFDITNADTTSLVAIVLAAWADIARQERIAELKR